MRDPLGALYKVTISYREPTYEARTGPRELPYRWTYTVRAGNEDEAQRGALAEFRETTRLSWVGWSREVVAVDVRPAEPFERLSSVIPSRTP